MIFRRRLKQKTNYRKRLGLIKSGSVRLVIRKSLSHITIQFIEFNEKADKTLLTINSAKLKKLGWKYWTGNVPAAYLIGLLAGKEAKKKNITSAVLDTGLQTNTKGSRIYAALKGVVDAEINVPHSKEIFPSEDRIKGKHIKDEIEKNFNEVKEMILK